MSSSWSQEKYIEACFYAAEALNKKTFLGTNLPFTIHINLVSMEVMAALQVESGLDGDLALQCALLHDVIDYGDKTIEELRQYFGYKVAQGVQALSKLDGVPELQRITDSLSRIQKQPREIWIVKMADKITSLASPPKNWTSKIIETYRKDALQTYETLKPASAFLANRLSIQIKASEKYVDH
jgi:(p)ppGpp synthase/HD superfamily hydrolase